MNRSADYLESLLKRASLETPSSKYWLALLNFVLQRFIPFNRAHRIRVQSITDNAIVVSLPYRQSNLNHLKGLHACALATAAEFATGLLLISKLKASEYRLIMSKMALEYHYQGKTNALARFEISDQWLKDNVNMPLESTDSCMINVQTVVEDISGEHLCSGFFEWQVKPWKNVRTTI